MNSRSLRSRMTPTMLLVVVLLTAGCTTALVGKPLAEKWFGDTPPASEGYVPDGTRLTAFDDVPAVTALDSDLLDAVRAAATSASSAGVTLQINSGWRSRAYQQWLLDEAVDAYGSYQEARRWVATPEESHHTSGNAVDIGPPEAATWLETYGGHWGLCRVYQNEPWHFELVGSDGGCPALVPDASG